MIVHLDFETRSRADLPSVGAHRYAIDPSTEILMCAVSGANPGDPIYLWVNPDHGDPVQNAEAEDLIARASLLYAHNAPFEQAIVWGTHARGAKSPFKRKPDLGQWRCTAALARKAGLPASLEKCADALDLPVRKDLKGKALIRFFSIPNPKTGEFNRPQDFPEKWTDFCEYCRQDVRVEKAIHAKLKSFDLAGLALETFQFTLRMNQLGVPVNVRALRNAQTIIDDVQRAVTTEFVALTGLQPTQRDAVKDWLAARGLVVENMQADTLDAVPKSNTPEYRALELYRKLSYAAVKKVSSMLDWACPDGRLRGVFTYHGAGPGRWTAGGPQMQNAKKPTEAMAPLTQPAYYAVGRGISAEGMDLIYGDPYELLASMVRHFVEAEGQELLDGDYNAVEARIACWVSGQDDILEAWRLGKDLYRRATGFVFGIPEESVDRTGRAFGKVVELACQFGLGTYGFVKTCESWGIPCTEELAQRAVHEYYRPTHQKIVARWDWEDRMLRAAVLNPGSQHGPFTVRNIGGKNYLLSKLPSGRSIAYADPKMEMRTTDYGQKMAVSYWGNIQGATWGRVWLYGALSFQNRVQGIGADLIAHGAMQAERDGMPPFALIHDQGLAIRPAGKTADDFARSLATLPSWATGLPLKVEAKVTPFYCK